MHIVDALITERARKLSTRPVLWPLARITLLKALGYRHAIEIADTVALMSGRQSFDHVSSKIGISTQTYGIENVPKSGPLIIVCNHPTGLADGLFMHQVLQPLRPEHLYLANADALRVMPSGGDIIIPVEWIEDRRTTAKTKLTLSLMKDAVAQDKCIVIFPSGRLASRKNGKMIEKPWMQTAAAFARKHNVPIVPAHLSPKNSWLYYVFCKISKELRDITLFREMLNKGNTLAHIKFGPIIDPQSLPERSKEATQALKDIVESLADKNYA